MIQFTTAEVIVYTLILSSIFTLVGFIICALFMAQIKDLKEYKQPLEGDGYAEEVENVYY